MVLEIVCSNCNSSLYSGIDLKSVRDVLKINSGKCDKCGSNLSMQNFSLEVTNISK